MGVGTVRHLNKVRSSPTREGGEMKVGRQPSVFPVPSLLSVSSMTFLTSLLFLLHLFSLTFPLFSLLCSLCHPPTFASFPVKHGVFVGG